MQIAMSAVPQIFAAYLTETVIPKAPTGLTQFGIGFAVPYLQKSVDAYLTKNAEMLKQVGIVDADGRIDVDVAKAAAAESLSKAQAVTVLGYRLDQSDLDALVAIASRYQ